MAGRRRAANVIHERPGSTVEARQAHTLLETWSLCLPNTLLEKIVLYTQRKGDELDLNYNFTLTELKCLIGFMYYRGASLDSQIKACDLFCEDSAPFYRTVTSRNSLTMWFRCLRIDDIETREERKLHDNFAPFREIFED